MGKERNKTGAANNKPFEKEINRSDTEYRIQNTEYRIQRGQKDCNYNGKTGAAIQNKQEKSTCEDTGYKFQICVEDESVHTYIYARS